MKKIIAIALCFVLCVSVVSAESPSLAELSTEELLELADSIQVELSNRDEVSVSDRIGKGKYIVGQDIKSGFYDFLCLKSGLDSDGEPSNTISIYSVDSETGEIIDRLRFHDSIEIGEHVTIRLDEGTALDIWGCSGILVKIESPSWAP